jgi:DNA-binding winged helix-turn-helix (wHTH) protein
MTQTHRIAETSHASLDARGSAFMLQRWLVDPASRQLQHLDSGEVRSLEPRLMRLLCLLCAAPGRVLSRESLMEELWPRVVVNENSLTRAVSELRRRLETDSTDASLIDTIPKTGYRLATHCRVQDVDSTTDFRRAAGEPMRAQASFVSPSTTPRLRLPARPLLGGAISMALGAFMLLGAQGLLTADAPTPAAYPLADINLSSETAAQRLVGGHLAPASATLTDDATPGLEISPLSGTQPVRSSDGRLFAMVRYGEEGSSLLLGSTELPNSPVTVLSTQDVIYNLQWSPLDRALLFAQAPRLAPASLQGQDERASLVMFDLDSFQTRLLQGPDVKYDTNPEAREQTRGFKLTALTRHFDWLS